MRILIAVEPTLYRESIAYVIRNHRPDFDDDDDVVRLAEPGSLGRAATSFRPHLIVCSDDAPRVRGVGVSTWVVIRYHDHLSASVFLEDQEPRLFEDMTIEDLLGVLEETQRLLA